MTGVGYSGLFQWPGGRHKGTPIPVGPGKAVAGEPVGWDSAVLPVEPRAPGTGDPTPLEPFPCLGFSPIHKPGCAEGQSAASSALVTSGAGRSKPELQD